jgi:RNA-directed DNA polymerase
VRGTYRNFFATFWTRKGFGPPKFAIEFDVKQCFDRISHHYILDNVASVKFGEETVDIVPHHIMQQWLTCGYVLADDIAGGFYDTTGVPQGGPIYPCICNMVMNGIQVRANDPLRGSSLPPFGGVGSLVESDP